MQVSIIAITAEVFTKLNANVSFLYYLMTKHVMRKKSTCRHFRALCSNQEVRIEEKIKCKPKSQAAMRCLSKELCNEPPHDIAGPQPLGLERYGPSLGILGKGYTWMSCQEFVLHAYFFQKSKLEKRLDTSFSPLFWQLTQAK